MIHLHTRSYYSLLESSLSIERIIALAQKNRQSAVALCDHRSMYGTMEFLHAAKNASLKPIVGLEFEIRIDEQLHPIVLLAKNTRGLQNLFALSTRLMAQEEILPFEDLPRYTEETILFTAPADDLLCSMATAKDDAAISDYFQALQSAASDVWFGVSLQDSPLFRRANVFLRQIASELEIESAALSGIEYENEDDEKLVRLTQAIARSRQIDDPDLKVRKGRFWRSKREMSDLYLDEDLENTERIAAMIEEYRLPEAQLPVFENRYGLSSGQFLRQLCLAGLKKRLGARRRPEYSARLEHELDVIVKMGFADYFLIVYDFIREARARQVLVGPGRGSAAGSLVAWCLGITHIDPLANGLLFERFLNEERVSMPDIDTDFPDDRRDEIIEYVNERYGDHHVAHIVTFARMKARLALRDTGRALGIAPRQIDELTRLIPNNPQHPVTLREVYETNRAFSSAIQRSPAFSRLYQLASAIEGFPRHTSVHAGGIVLARDPIENQAPLTFAGASLPAVQFTMEHLEELGLIKFDFLALRNLTMLEQMRVQIETLTGRPLDLLRLSLDDPAVYHLLRQGDTLGVFQLESEGIRALIVRYQPERFEDIAAILALYRPGPMKNIQVFLDAHHHGSRCNSMHPLLDPILAETGGIFVYQEQIMEASRIIGGFSLAQADILRKAMSKKKRDVMESWKEKFIAGASARQIDPATAARIFETMEQFADYGFNKSHSYAYGLIVYWMAWIKARHPLVFYQAALSGCMGSPAKTEAFLAELSRRGLPALPVDLNRSQAGYAMENGRLRMPLSLIKGLGRQSVEAILQERQQHGPFDDAPLALIRLSRLKLNAAQIGDLIAAGALDSLFPSREGLLASQEEIVRLSDLVMLSGDSRWRYAGITPPTIENRPPQLSRRLADEFRVLGFYISRHPSALLRSRNRRIVSVREALERSGHMQVCGIIGRVKEIRTKKGDPMAFVSFSDDTGSMEMAVMPNLYERMKPLLIEGALVSVEGRKDRPKSLLANEITVVDPDRLG